tara:strand:- start:714 stop:3185 length:2472 start_codon:yes stop_codon:yes gene_type:complete
MAKSQAKSTAKSVIKEFTHDCERHLKYSVVKDKFTKAEHDEYYSLSLAVRDRIIDRWFSTQKRYYQENCKRVYYLSLEFLLGRMLENNVINLGIEDEVRVACKQLGVDYDDLREVGEDHGLGNGGLGRLAACFLDSLASLSYPAVGYGIRYEYGIFRQEIKDGFQVEEPDNWLARGNPWEVACPNLSVIIRFGGRLIKPEGEKSNELKWVDTNEILAVPYDTPVVGFENDCVNTLRLWSARATHDFDFQEFNDGDYFAAVQEKNAAEKITKVLYPNDNNYEGKALRFKQQYFFVSASIQDIIKRYKRNHSNFDSFADKVAIQLNDTHPALTVLELMRILMDEEGLDWPTAWQMTVKTCAYTNHTLLPEALEKWSVNLFEEILPRHLNILYEINRLFLRDVSLKYAGDQEKIIAMSLIQEQPERSVRMAYLSIVGSHSINGVAELHSKLLKKDLLSDFAALYPERFNNKTNGVTPRRWLLQCNPQLADLISEKIGRDWITDLSQLTNVEKHLKDKVFRKRFNDIKANNKKILADLIEDQTGLVVDSKSIFDVHIKRIHEYKRQLMNILHTIMLYRKLKSGALKAFHPMTVIFGGKAAPGYFMAKLVIKLINSVAEFINVDPDTNDKLKVVFVPNYRISVAEKMFPATDLSEQISTAGFEASGTGNMKFALNGALTIGTMDGANVEMAEEIGEEHMFIFGLRVNEIEQIRKADSYNAWDVYNENREIRDTLDLVRSGFFSPKEPDLFEPIIHSLLNQGDRFFVLKDLEDYDRARLQANKLYKDRKAWTDKAILNMTRIGKFSSDRTINEYAKQIWRIEPVPAPLK